MNNILQNSKFLNIIKESNLSFGDGSINEEQTLDNYTRSNEEDFAFHLERLDEEFLNSQYRKDNFYVKQIRERTYVSLVGTINFSRRQYQTKHDGSYYYFIDDIIDLPPFKRLSWGVIKKVLKQVTTDSYQRIANDLEISKGSVYNLIKSLRDKLIVSPLPKKKKIDFLYIQTDECYVRLQKKYPNRKNNLIMLEQITIHEGLEFVCKGRNRLKNRKLYTRAHIESKEEFYERVNQDILASYDYENIYLYGDGADWIKNAADSLGATYITDLFHTMQAVIKLTRDKDWRQVLTEAIIKDDKETFTLFYETILLSSNPSKYRLNNYNYLMNHWVSIQRNYKLASSIGCSQEGINSHYYASRLTTRPKGFNEASSRVIAQLINIKENKDNFEFEIEEQIIKPVMKDIRNKRKTYKDIYIPPQGSFVTTHKLGGQLNRISHPYE